MAVLPGALLSVPRVSVEAAKTRANEQHLLAVSLPSPHFIDLRAQPKPPCYTCQLSRLRVENFDLTPAHACGPISHA